MNRYAPPDSEVRDQVLIQLGEWHVLRGLDLRLPFAEFFASVTPSRSNVVSPSSRVGALAELSC